MRRIRRSRVLLALVVGVVALAASVFMVGRWALYGSLARTSGTVRVAGLGGSVRISLDAHGAPTIRGETFGDCAAGLGFVHAQERFFQMDVSRRVTGGRLAELFGGAALESDIRARRLGFHEVARETVERLPDDLRAWLEAYTRGVNAGLDDLGVRPPEYWLLRAEPEAWRVEDCVLVSLMMHDYLSLSAPFELMRMEMEARLPGDVVDFLMPVVGRFDRQVVTGGASGGAVAPYPSPGSIESLREIEREGGPEESEPVRGSNGWVVSGARTAHGGAILANDMHLGLRVPTTWYRAMVVWEKESVERRAVGVTLPGVPGIVAGTTDELAWGFTNVTGDFQDYVVLDDAEYEAANVRREVIGVKGGADHELVVRDSEWGPIVDEDVRGRHLAMAWGALDAKTLNMNILRMPLAQTVEEGIEVGRSWWGPPQNMMLAGRDGRVGWVMTGYLPERVGFDGRVPIEWGDGVGWDDALGEEERGVVVDPDEGFIATANQRTLAVERSGRFGAIWALGARAKRIGDVLDSEQRVDERDMLALQLDTRVEVLDLYRDLVVEVAQGSESEEFAQALDLAEQWGGGADGGDMAVYLLDTLRLNLHDALLAPLTRGVGYDWLMREEVVQRIVRDRPGHLLPDGETTWRVFFERVLQETVEDINGDGLSGAAWGETNRASIRHPLSRAVPALAGWLDMAGVGLPGHRYAVRVQRPSFGASERLVVSPGHLEEGIFHMPGGQSGHPLSAHYRDGFDDWIHGRATALMPGEVMHSFTLEPAD